ncbi:MAG: anhydro-N-acetylmuramic acid kinase [Pseudomonadota bacterium]
MDRLAGLFIGCITGTSVDALDLALITATDNHLNIEHADCVPLPTALRATLLELGQPDNVLNLDDLGNADAELGEFVGHSILNFTQQAQASIDDVIAIGSHGQTIRHRPGAFTLQIGDANRIAEITGRPTVADFRRRDMAAGGQGAPLVPPFHQALFGHQPNCVVLNIGGISNITVLGEQLSGFDTGPGNALLDSWYSQHHPDADHSYDPQGQWASGASVDGSLLSRMLSDRYFSLPPPKSTGREYFNLQWLSQHLENQSPADVQATLAQLTARSVIQAIDLHAPDCNQLVVCGGGRLNQDIMARLDSSTSYPVLACETLGVDGDSVEAAAFAWLAYRTINHLSGNAPGVTGASDYRVLGALYPDQGNHG